MQEILINKLHDYIRQNNPDVLFTLEENNEITTYLSNKVDSVKDVISGLQQAGSPAYIIEEICLEALIKGLRPSRYNYIINLLEEDFEYACYSLRQLGTLQYEVINMLNKSVHLFDSFDFNERNEENRQLRYAVMAIISEYLEKN